ncbi:hypothetical protein GCM10027614_80990 [Micromonospora vulcania]
MSEESKELADHYGHRSGVEFAGMRITVIEDDDRVARGLVTVLAQAGFEVHRIATAARPCGPRRPMWSWSTLVCPTATGST